MRLKETPEDFRVRELLDFEAVANGEHVVHLLHKEKLSTPEALAMVVQEAGVDRAGIAYAGLKDRQAITDQYISIAGRAVEISKPHLRLTPVGRTDRPITSRMSRGNAFAIVVRDLRPTDAAQLRRNLPSLQKTGFPNYFDDQRFGSLRHGQGFPMLHIVRGDFELALRRLIATPSPVAISGDVKLKRALHARWGDWDGCRDLARGPIWQSLFGWLQQHPDDFRSAIEHLPLRQRVIHAFAFQSVLWNRAVSSLLRGGVGSAQRVRIRTLAGDLIGWKYLDPEREQKLVAMRTPLYAPDGDGGSEPFARATAEVLEELRLHRDDFLRNQIPGMIWKEEPREVLIKPQDLADVSLAPDEMHDGRVAATLSFSLPRGAYATMMLKRLLAPMWYPRAADGTPLPPTGGFGGGPPRSFRDSRPLPPRREPAAPRAGAAAASGTGGDDDLRVEPNWSPDDEDFES
ncbi:MAG: tRNA pseudouridine(13) synthase TruD [Planctomycetes bacterium]|nr:tRNA pseudouridine(13) synthase TruD [Planctomycetota bacterium]